MEEIKNLVRYVHVGFATFAKLYPLKKSRHLFDIHGWVSSPIAEQFMIQEIKSIFRLASARTTILRYMTGGVITNPFLPQDYVFDWVMSYVIQWGVDASDKEAMAEKMAQAAEHWTTPPSETDIEKMSKLFRQFAGPSITGANVRVVRQMMHDLLVDTLKDFTNGQLTTIYTGPELSEAVRDEYLFGVLEELSTSKMPKPLAIPVSKLPLEKTFPNLEVRDFSMISAFSKTESKRTEKQAKAEIVGSDEPSDAETIDSEEERSEEEEPNDSDDDFLDEPVPGTQAEKADDEDEEDDEDYKEEEEEEEKEEEEEEEEEDDEEPVRSPKRAKVNE